MNIWLRRTAYMGTAIIGFLAVQQRPLAVVAYTLRSILIELTFLLSLCMVGGILYIAWQQWDGQFSRTTLLHTVVLLLLLPLTVTSGALLYESQTWWQPTETHWHANLTIVADGNPVTVRSPAKYCDNPACRHAERTGSPRLHTHNDSTIHVHGPLPVREDATLGKFFAAFGGALNMSSLHVPTNTGWTNRTADGNRSVQVIVHQRAANTWCTAGNVSNRWQCTDPHTGIPVTRPEEYMISPYTDGPTDHVYVTYTDRSPVEQLQYLQSTVMQ